jgi:hypothetical protein
MILAILSEGGAASSKGLLRMKMDTNALLRGCVFRGDLIDCGELHGQDGFFGRRAVALGAERFKFRQTGEQHSGHKRNRKSG